MIDLLKEQLKEYKVISTVKVQLGDMDALKHVNNNLFENLNSGT
jgi:acyl-CoA thioester hydrolase